MTAGEEFFVGIRVLVDTDGEDNQVRAIVVELEKGWQLDHTGGAPGSPEVDHDHLAAIVGEVNGGGTVGDGEVGGEFAGLCGMGAAIAGGS